MNLKLITVTTVFASVLAVLVGIVGWLVTIYAPLWVVVASIPVMAWLLIVLIAFLVDRGWFDRWES